MSKQDLNDTHKNIRMASSQPVQDWYNYKAYDISDIYFLRSIRIFSVIAGVMQYVFLEGIKHRSADQSLLTYFVSRKNGSKFLRTLSISQKNLIENNPDGSRFDITLLFKCIQQGCDKLADKNDDAWKIGKECLESFLTELKNWRNEICHELPKYNDQKFFSETEQICSLLSKVLKHAGILYGIRKTDTEKMINGMRSMIYKLRDESWMPLDFEAYKKLTLYSVKENHVRDEGKICLYRLYKDWIIICPSSLLSEVNFKVEEVYTSLTLKRAKEQGGNIPQKLDDLLDGIDHSSGDRVIFLEGDAGSGKSTLTKKMLSDWIYGNQNAITKLNDYDLLLYTEFRKPNLKSFKELVSTLMPGVAKSYAVEDFCRIIRNLKVLVILDGLDELNDSSLLLFKEILDMKEMGGISVMVTSRPERVETYYSLAETKKIQTKHIMITGIAEERREEFVGKYYREIEKKGETQEDIEGLLKFLRQTARRLSHLWQLPYNLMMLVILWIRKSQIVNSITTATELYWEIYELYREKVSARMLSRMDAQAWDDSLRKEKVKDLMALLGKIALICLGNDKIELSEDDYKDLDDQCKSKSLPAEEITGAFLKTVKINTGISIETRYSFPHKSLQEFLAAVHILMEAEHKTRISGKRAFPQCSSASTSNAPTEEADIIRNIIENTTETSSFDIKKYKNVLVSLIGLFHMRKVRIKDSIKIEVLHLLQEAGVNNKYEWLRILDSVKCDAVVATFISQKFNIFQGEIQICDQNVCAFHSLLQAHPFPIKAADVIIEIILKDETPFIGKLLEMVNENKFHLKTLQIYNHIRNPGVHTIEAVGHDGHILSDACQEGRRTIDAISAILQRCAMKVYRGSMVHGIRFSSALEKLYVSLATEDDIKQLQAFLDSHPVNTLGVCLSAKTESSIIQTLEHVIDFCYVVDVTKSNISSAVEILRNLRYHMYGSLWFPRSTLEYQDQLDLITKLAEVEVAVSSEIHFPSTIQPSSDEQRKKINEEARKKLGCFGGVYWGNVLGCDIDDW